jgi:hypothetical protein
VRITAQAQEIALWIADAENVVGTLQNSPVASSQPSRQITLIPMGATQLRITSFPQAGGTNQWGAPSVSGLIQNRTGGRMLAVDQGSTTNAAQVVQSDDSGTADQK